jgi:hypothetical protein
VDIILRAVRGRVSSVSGSTITLAGPFGTSRTIDVTPTTRYFQHGAATTAAAVQPGDRVAAFGDPATSAGATFTALVVDIVSRPRAAETDRPDVRNPADPSRLVGDHRGRPDPHREAQPTSAPTPVTTVTTPVTTSTTVEQPAAEVRGVVVSVSGDTITVDPGALDQSEGARAVVVTGATRFVADGSPATVTAVAPGDVIFAAGTIASTGTLTATTVDVLRSAPTASQPRSPTVDPTHRSTLPAPDPSRTSGSAGRAGFSGGSAWTSPSGDQGQAGSPAGRSGSGFGGSGGR